MSPSRVEMTRSGGVAGVQLRGVIDTATLAPEEAAEVEVELGKINLSDLAARPVSRGGPPDRFQYDLIIEHDGTRHQMTIGERDLPPSLVPLIERLIVQSRQRPS